MQIDPLVIKQVDLIVYFTTEREQGHQLCCEEEKILWILILFIAPGNWYHDENPENIIK